MPVKAQTVTYSITILNSSSSRRRAASRFNIIIDLERANFPRQQAEVRTIVIINPCLTFKRLAVVMAMAASGHVGASAEPSGVEYALRWNPQDGGPGTAEAVFRLLGMTAGIPEHYEVRS